ncbi:MAG: hypothetical protein ROO73_00135 [Roseivirga sp.]
MNTNNSEQRETKKSFTVAPLKDLTATGDINAEGKLRQNGHELLPAGSIIMWSGTTDNVPPGWILCDGNNNTPDLKGRFIVAADKSSTDYQAQKLGGYKVNLPAQSFTTDSQGNHQHGLPYEGWYKGWCHGDKWNTPLLAFHENSQNETIPSSSQNTKESGAHMHSVSVAISHAGGATEDLIRPRYYALAFIMKL